jgi:hypothetical protein
MAKVLSTDEIVKAILDDILNDAGGRRPKQAPDQTFGFESSVDWI